MDDEKVVLSCAYKTQGCRSEVLKTHWFRYGWVFKKDLGYICPSHARRLKDEDKDNAGQN
jgi:hypothetical protein